MSESTPFRQEAAEHHRRRKVEGRVLRIAPRWTRFTYWLLLIAVVAGLTFMCVGRIAEYAEGAAVVRLTDRIPLTAPTSGRVAMVLVEPGQRVSTGSPLIRFDTSEERAELQRLRQERFAVTSRFLIDGGGSEAGRQLGALQAEERRAEASIRNKTIHAPFAGSIGDLRVRVGQDAKLGDEMVTLVRSTAGARVVAIIPGHYRPLLRPGLDLRLEFSGLSYAYRHLVVESVADEAIGPNEVRRYFGPDLSDALELRGPAVLVQAVVDDPWVEAGRERYPIHDGMLGEASLVVRRERIVFSVLPGLRELWVEDPP